MSILGNILWIILGGLIVSAMYFLAGLFMCITIIGIPFGLQLWKLAVLALCPFGKEVSFSKDPGCLSVGFNVLWIIGGWWETALVHLIFGLLCAITIIGIPFAKQHFKLMKMSLMPFGMNIG
ncbi:MAG: YccF domain-containing protein [Bacteroidales bacterium]|nr:YccF domain-containing protein [Bacteroidales bacterium]